MCQSYFFRHTPVCCAVWGNAHPGEMLHARVLVALLAASIALRKDAVAFKGGLTLGSSSLRPPRRGAASQRHVVQPNSRRRRPTTTTSMSLLRTFEASELQLQRFIGELGFVEITDW